MPRREHKDRAITYYTSSPLERQEFQQKATEAQVSLSKWSYEMILRGLESESQKAASRQVPYEDYQSQIFKLHEELKVKDLLLEKQTTDLVKLRDKFFLQDKPYGQGTFNFDLMKLLETGAVITESTIFEKIHVNPSDAEAYKIIINQLRMLEKFGAIEQTMRGWRRTKK